MYSRREINKLDHVTSNNIKQNKVNSVIGNELEFDSSHILANNTVKYPLHIVTISLIWDRNYTYLELRSNMLVG